MNESRPQHREDRRSEKIGQVNMIKKDPPGKGPIGELVSRTGNFAAHHGVKADAGDQQERNRDGENPVTDEEKGRIARNVSVARLSLLGGSSGGILRRFSSRRWDGILLIHGATSSINSVDWGV